MENQKKTFRKGEQLSKFFGNVLLLEFTFPCICVLIINIKPDKLRMFSANLLPYTCVINNVPPILTFRINWPNDKINGFVSHCFSPECTLLLIIIMVAILNIVWTASYRFLGKFLTKYENSWNLWRTEGQTSFFF